MIDLYVLIAAIIAKIFNPTAELVITIGMPTKEGNAENENVQSNFKPWKLFARLLTH